TRTSHRPRSRGRRGDGGGGEGGVAAHASGAPHPPPPGVSIRSTSPARIWTVHLSSNRSALDSSPPGSSQFSPGAPAEPPHSPHGRLRRRSVISDTVTSSSTSRSRSIPSPPAWRPAPPL